MTYASRASKMSKAEAHERVVLKHKLRKKGLKVARTLRTSTLRRIAKRLE